MAVQTTGHTVRIQPSKHSSAEFSASLAQTIGTIGMDPYVVLGVLVEGDVPTLIDFRWSDGARTTLLRELIEAHRLPGSER